MLGLACYLQTHLASVEASSTIAISWLFADRTQLVNCCAQIEWLPVGQMPLPAQKKAFS